MKKWKLKLEKRPFNLILGNYYAKLEHPTHLIMYQEFFFTKKGAISWAKDIIKEYNNYKKPIVETIILEG